MEKTDRYYLEMKSSAITLSDMEVFIFPELMFSLVLANIMSPRIWEWRKDKWFKNFDKLTPYRRIVRLKQFIMDHYVFNLDLDTWGMTSKEKELDRFKDIIDIDHLRQSNALFGYEGDKYYFDIDIRTHFGLDKYDDATIPYWKTETVEAMDAFRYRDGFTVGAGECVSLGTLYAASLFIIAEIPLSDIFLMATPLHSQNFIDIEDGIITNNRRLVTKNMWFNGTPISAQARRALENERVTFVTNETGYVHTLYKDATMDPATYDRFTDKLKGYLEINLGDDTLGNFLRHSTDIQKCFQIRWNRQGRDCYISAERVFAYERSSSYLLTDQTRQKLMEEIDAEEFRYSPYSTKIVFNDLEEYVRTKAIDFNDETHLTELRKHFESDCLNAVLAIESVISFCRVQPRLPKKEEKNFVTPMSLGLKVGMERDEIIELLNSQRGKSLTVDLAFYAYRDLREVDPVPFFKAAFERNPVSIEALSHKQDEEIVAQVRNLT
ncbi:MAG: hypothetical protein GX811_11780, partial [Lentisphaerae bacterium]|nr:hypothetical protein [Lentisphaerota bacterium]